MAKRRDLKKEIENISGNLITEVLLCSLQPDTDKSKLEEMMLQISTVCDEYRKRAQHPTANANKKIVKQYYTKLRKDFDAEVDALYAEIMKPEKERAVN